MKSAALHRLETLLQAKNLDATLHSPWQAREWRTVPTGVTSLDAQLGGGWRRGELSELIGCPSSGRTSVMLSTMAAVTRHGDVAALVDTVDRFDPESAAAAGVDLDRMLWVRGPALTVEMTPRNGSRGSSLDRAVHQALRAADLIVRAGGFGLVVLDLADIPGRSLERLPFTTWLRLAQVLDGRPTACLLLGQTTMGRSPRGASIALAAGTVTTRWTGASAQSRRFGGFALQAAAGAHTTGGSRLGDIRHAGRV